MEWVVTLLLLGALMIFAETLLPGLITGIIGFCLLIAGVAIGFLQFGPRTGSLLLVFVLLGLVVGAGAWAKYFPQSAVARLFTSQRTIGNVGAEQPELLHQQGTAYTQLRPSGTALINGKKVDVVTEGGLIEKGTPVEVVAIEGMRVVVRSLTS